MEFIDELIDKTNKIFSNDEMTKSILKIKKINKNIILYPGHGDKTTLDKEKQNNFYFNNEWN